MTRQILWLAFGFTLPALAAQEPRRLTQPDSVPADLAAALIAAGGLPGPPQILIGAVPGFVASRLYVPRSGKVLGSAFLGTTVVAIVTIPSITDTALVEFRREMLKRNWKLPPPAPSFGGGGFRPAPASAEGAPSRVVLCDDRQTVYMTSATRSGIATDVTYRIVTGGAGGVCNPPQLGMSFPRSPYPTLFNPAGTSDARMNGDCSATLAGSSGTGTTLRTAMTPESLLDHYGRQLQDSGWTPSADRAAILGRIWTRTDSSGAPVEVTLSVTTPARDAECRELNLQVRTLRKP
jgi:hypothetical protein